MGCGSGEETIVIRGCPLRVKGSRLHPAAATASLCRALCIQQPRLFGCLANRCGGWGLNECSLHRDGQAALAPILRMLAPDTSLPLPLNCNADLLSHEPRSVKYNLHRVPYLPSVILLTRSMCTRSQTLLQQALWKAVCIALTFA